MVLTQIPCAARCTSTHICSCNQWIQVLSGFPAQPNICTRVTDSLGHTFDQSNQQITSDQAAIPHRTHNHQLRAHVHKHPNTEAPLAANHCSLKYMDGTVRALHKPPVRPATACETCKQYRAAPWRCARSHKFKTVCQLQTPAK